MRFAIFTHVIHTEEAGVYSAYAPYVREMNLWLRNVQEVEIVAPELPPPPKGEPLLKKKYRHSQITFNEVASFDLLNFGNILKAIIKIPLIIIEIVGAMKRADHLHLRCPGNVGLLACACQIFFPYKPKTAKYAGNWAPNAQQPWSYRVQKWILSNKYLTRNMTVLVYGQWQNQSKNILPFFTASFSENEKEIISKNFNPPFKFLFVGNLVSGKKPVLAIRLVKFLKERNIPAELHIYGDGALKNGLEIKAENKVYIHLHGNQPLDVVKQAYKESHFLVLASKSEGWPKAVAEAMFFGCIPIATPVSCVPWMLNYGSRGILIPKLEKREKRREKRVKLGVDRGKREDDKEKEKNEELKDTVERIIELVNDPVEMRRMSREAQEWSQQYTLEKFEAEIKKILILGERQTLKQVQGDGID